MDEGRDSSCDGEPGLELAGQAITCRIVSEQTGGSLALVESTPKPTTEQIRHAMAGNLCRCGAYPKIEEAIRTWRD